VFFFRKKQAPKSFDKPVIVDPAERPKVRSAPVRVSTAGPEEAIKPSSDEPVVRKRRRPVNANKTRLMGFDTSDGRVVDLFGEDKATKTTGRTQFAVAMVMVADGPGRGECFALPSGMSQIGRGEDQAVQLDFGDMAISRENHAAIVYDPKEHTFLLGHGGKSNIVRLNGKPVVTTSDLKDGDEIEIGETKLRFAALCSGEFNWENVETDEGDDDDDVEIA